MKNGKSFTLIWSYLKHDKIKLFIYVFLTLLTFFPQLVTAYLWGKALEYLLAKNFMNFALYLFVYEILFMFFYGLVELISDKLYKTLEIKFIKNITKDLYSKLISLPSKAF